MINEKQTDSLSASPIVDRPAPLKEFTWEIVLDRFENELWRFPGEQSWRTPEEPPQELWDVADLPPE